MRNWYKSSSSRMALATSLALAALATSGATLAAPTGGQVAAGQASISGQGSNAVLVTQSTDRAIITWQTFNTATGQSIQFVQPSNTSIALNRVLGGGPSSLNGSLTANGQVFIINPNGVLFSKSSQVNVAGLLVSTADLNAASFMSGATNLRFDVQGSPSAVIENDGAITIAESGLAAFVAPQVINSGIITARYGRIAIGAAQTFTLDLNGDGLISFSPGDGATSAPHGGAAIQAGGQLVAESGTVTLTAATARQVVNQSIEVTGLISAAATSVAANGKIHLGGGTVTLAAAGDVKLDQSASLNAASAQGTGGKITVTGTNIEVAGATLTASGATGGGQVLIGGGAQGQGSLAHAKTTVLDPGTQITADATVQGNGGHVVLWSDQATSFAGLISARGGALGGDGGLVETSSANNLQILGQVSAAAQAAAGADGTWLLDPADITISGSGSNSGVTQTGTTWAASGASGTLTAATLNAALQQGTNVTVDSTKGTGTSGVNGNITFASTSSAPISISSGSKNATLTLTAALGINFGTNTTFGLAADKGALSVVGTAAAGVIQGVGTSFNTHGGSVTLTATNPPAPSTWMVTNTPTGYGTTVAGAPSGTYTPGLAYSGAIYFNGLTLNLGVGTATLTGSAGANEPKTNGLNYQYDSGVLLGGIVNLTSTSTSANAISIIGAGRIGVMLGAPTLAMTTNGNVVISGTASGYSPMGAGIGLGPDLNTANQQYTVADQSGNLTLNGYFSGSVVANTLSFTSTLNGATTTYNSAAQFGIVDLTNQVTSIVNLGTGTLAAYGQPTTGGSEINDPLGALSFLKINLLNQNSGSLLLSGIGGIQDANATGIGGTLVNSATGTASITGTTAAPTKTGLDMWNFSVTNGVASTASSGQLTLSGTNTSTTGGNGVFTASFSVLNYGAFTLLGTVNTVNSGADFYGSSSFINYGSSFSLLGYGNGVTGGVGLDFGASAPSNLTVNIAQNGPIGSVFNIMGSGTAVGIYGSYITLNISRNSNGGILKFNGYSSTTTATGLNATGINFAYVSTVSADASSQANSALAGITLGGQAASGIGILMTGSSALTTTAGVLELDGNVGAGTSMAGINMTLGSSGLSLTNNGTTLTLVGQSIGGSGLLASNASGNVGALTFSGTSSGAISLIGTTNSPVSSTAAAVSLTFASLADTATSPVAITGTSQGGGGGVAMTILGGAGLTSPMTLTGGGTFTITGTTKSDPSGAGSNSGVSLTVSGGINDSTSLNGNGGISNAVALNLFGYAAGGGAGVSITTTGAFSIAAPLTVIGASGTGTGLALNAQSLSATGLTLIGNPTNSNNGGLTLPSIIPGVDTPGLGPGLSLIAPILSAATATLVGNSTSGTDVAMSDVTSISISGALTILGDPNAASAGAGAGVLLTTSGLNAASINITGYSTGSAGIAISDLGAFMAGTTTNPGSLTLTGGSTSTTAGGAPGVSLTATTLSAGALAISGTATAGPGVLISAKSLAASPSTVNLALIKGTSTGGVGLSLTLGALTAPRGLNLVGISNSGTGLSLTGGTSTTPFSVSGVYSTLTSGQTATYCTIVCFNGTSTSGTGLAAQVYSLSDTASLVFNGTSTASTGLSFTGGDPSTSFATTGINYSNGNLLLVGASTNGTGLALQSYGTWVNSLGLTGTGTSVSGTGLSFAMTGVGTNDPSVVNGSNSPSQSPAGLILSGVSTSGTGLNFLSGVYGFVNGAFSFTGQSLGTSSAPSGSGIIFSAASPTLTATQASLTFTGTRTAAGAGTADVALSGLSATGDANSTLTVNGDYIGFTNLTLGGFAAITFAPTDFSSGFSLLGMTAGSNIQINGASGVSTATLSIGSSSETGATSIASLTDTETGTLTIQGGAGALSVGGVTANLVSNLYLLDIGGTVASAGLTLSGPLSATKAAVVLGSNGAISTNSAVSAASLAVQAGGAITLNNTGNAFPLLAARTNAGSINIFDSTSITLTNLAGPSYQISGLVDISSLAADTVQLISTGAITIRQAISVGSSGTSSVPALVLAAGYGQNVSTQSINGLVTSGYDVSLAGSMLSSPANAISVGGQGTAAIYTGTLAGSVGMTDAGDGGVGTIGGYRYDSSLTATNYSLALGPGIDVIYREQPVLTATWSVNGALFANTGTGASASITYSGAPVTPGLAIASQLFNGDNVTLSGTLSATATVQATGKNPLNNGAAQDVGTYNFGATSISNGLGYAVIAPGPLSLTINPYTLNIDYGSGLTVQTKTYDGSTKANLIVTQAPNVALLGNDAQLVKLGYTNGSGPTGVFAQSDAGNNIAVSLNNLSLVSRSGSGGNANIISDYVLVGPSNLTGNITQAQLTFSGIAALSRSYNGGYSAQLQYSDNATINGWVSTADRTSVGVNFSALTGAFSTNQVGNNLQVNISAQIQGAGPTLFTGSAAAVAHILQDYNLVLPNVTANITPVTLTYNPGALSVPTRTYNGSTSATINVSNPSNPNLFSGYVGTDSAATTPAMTNKVAGVYDAPDAGNRTVIITPGSITLTGTDANDYVLPDISLAAIIKPATLVVSGLTAESKQYDGTTAIEIDTSGLNLNIPVPSDVGKLALAGTPTGVAAQKDVGGSVAVTVRNLSLAQIGPWQDYVLVVPQLTAAITPAPLTLSGLSVLTRAYDGTTSASLQGAAQLVGILGADQVQLSSNGAVANFASSAVGVNKTVTLSSTSFGLTGAQSFDYTLNLASLTGTITPKVLTVSGLSATDRSYNGTLSDTVTGVPVLVGVVKGESLAVNVVGLSGTLSDPNAGSQSVTVQGLTLTGATASNYVLQPDILSATITPAPLIVAGLTAQNKIYDGTTLATLTGTPQVEGLINTDQNAVQLVGTPTGSFASSNVGVNLAVALSGLALGGAKAYDYQLIPTTFSASISPATLTYVASPASRLLGTPNPTFSGTVRGLVGGQTLADATTGILNFSSAAGPFAPYGTYSIEGSGLAAINDNYVFTQDARNAAALTVVAPFNNGNIGITASLDSGLSDSLPLDTGRKSRARSATPKPVTGVRTQPLLCSLILESSVGCNDLAETPGPSAVRAAPPTGGR